MLSPCGLHSYRNVQLRSSREYRWAAQDPACSRLMPSTSCHSLGCLSVLALCRRSTLCWITLQNLHAPCDTRLTLDLAVSGGIWLWPTAALLGALNVPSAPCLGLVPGYSQCLRRDLGIRAVIQGAHPLLNPSPPESSGRTPLQGVIRHSPLCTLAEGCSILTLGMVESAAMVVWGFPNGLYDCSLKSNQIFAIIGAPAVGRLGLIQQQMGLPKLRCSLTFPFLWCEYCVSRWWSKAF